MDERDSVSVGNVDSETRVRVSEGLDDDDTPIGNFDGQVSGGGDDDVMVEVYGSDVFVDGVCSSGSRGNLDKERELEIGCDGSVEEGLVREEVLIVDQVVEVDQEVIETRASVNDERNSHTVEIAVGSANCSVDEIGVGKYSEAVVAAHEETRVVLVGQLVQNESSQHNESLDDEGSVHIEKINREVGSVDNETGKSGTESGIVSSMTIVEDKLSVEPPVEEHLNPEDEVPADFLKESACEDNESSFQRTQIIGIEISEVHNSVTVESKNDTFGDDNGNEGPVSSDSNQRFLNKTASEQTVESIVHEDSEVRGEIVAVDVIVALNGAQGPAVDGLETTKDGEKVKSGLNSITEHSPNCNISDLSSLDVNMNAVCKVVSLNTNAVSSMSSNDEGLYNQCQGIANDNSVADIDHHPSGLVVPHVDDNRFVETMDECYEVEDPHHEGSAVPVLVDTFGFPAPECLGNITKLGSDSEEEDMHAGQAIEAEEKGVVAKLPNTLGERHKATDSFDDDALVQDTKKSAYNAHLFSTGANPRQSYKIGDCISRVASKLTGSPLIRKINPDSFQKVDLGNQRSVGLGYEASFQTTEDPPRRILSSPSENSTPNKMLPNLHLVAQDPMTEFAFLNPVISFFSDFRNSVVPGRYFMRGSVSVDKVANGRKRKATHTLIGSPKTFEFEDMKDSYWTDRVIQNGSEEQPSRRNKREYHQSRASQPINLQASHGLHSRKKTDDGSISSHRSAAGRSITSTDMKNPDSTPTEVVMKFPLADSVPSEKELTIMFWHFGPLKESETEVDLETSRARVIFRKRLDAEVAFDSASTFNIWGHLPVSYELNYSPSEPFKAPPVVPSQDLEAAIAQDMEMAATEYLGDATTQYLDGVSIQYLEDETTQYMEGASVHYLEDGPIQYLEVSLPQPQEHDKNQTVVDASCRVVGVATTEHPEATTTHNLKDSLSENPQITDKQQNLEDAAAQKLKNPSQNLEVVETEQILEDVAPQGQKSPNLGVEVQNVGGAAAPHNLDYGTTENDEDATTHYLPDSTAGHMQDETKVDTVDDTMKEGMEEEAAHAFGDTKGTKVQSLEGSVPLHSDYETTQHLEVAIAHDLGDSKTELIQDDKTVHIIMSDVKTPGTEAAASPARDEVEGEELQTMVLDSETSQSSEAAMAHYLDNSTTEMQDATVVQYTNNDDATTLTVEAAATQTIDDVKDGEVQNVDVSGSQHFYGMSQNLEAEAAQAIDVQEGEVQNVDVSVPQNSYKAPQHLEAAAAHAIDVPEQGEVQNVEVSALQHLDAAEHHLDDAMSQPLEVDVECDGNDVRTQGVEEADLQTIDDPAEHHMEDAMSHGLEVDMELDD